MGCFQHHLCTYALWSVLLQSLAWITYCLLTGLRVLTLSCLLTSPPSNSSHRSSQTRIWMCDLLLLNICQWWFPIAFRIKPKFLIMARHKFGLSVPVVLSISLCTLCPPDILAFCFHFSNILWSLLPQGSLSLGPTHLTSPSPASLSPTTLSS